MANTITFGGLASGLDTNTLVAQLVALRRAPITTMETQKTALSKRLTVMNDLKTKMLALREKVGTLDTRAEFASKNAVVSDETYFTARAESAAVITSYQVEVDQLARAQRSASQGFAAASAEVGAGVFSITQGGETFDLTLAAGTTLETLRDAINASDADVTASIVNVGGATPYRLVLAADQTGEASAFSVDAAQLTGGTNPTFSTTATALDALVSIDGLDVRSASNTIDAAIEGVSLTLRRATAAGQTVTLGIESDHGDLQAKLESFVSAYNDVVKLLNEQSARGSTLQGETSLRTIQSQMSNLLIKAPSSEGSFRILADVGIKLANDGLLELDQQKLDEVLSDDFEGVLKLFVEEGGVQGFAARLDDKLADLTNFSTGVFKHGADSINERIRLLDRRIEQEEDRVDSYEEMLTRRFSAMERVISQLQAQNVLLGGGS